MCIPLQIALICDRAPMCEMLMKYTPQTGFPTQKHPTTGTRPPGVCYQMWQKHETKPMRDVVYLDEFLERTPAF